MSQQGGRYGYGRVSKRDQHTEAQREALIAAGCDPDHLFIEKISSRVDKRPQLEAALAYLRRGDTLVVTKLDRLGRSVRDLIDLVARIEKLGVDLVILHQNIDTSTPSGKMFFHILAAFAEFEREMIRQRTLEGLEAARARGRTGGRGFKLNEMQEKRLAEMYDAEVPLPGDDPGPGERPRTMPKYTTAQIAEELGIGRDTVYAYLRRTRDGGAETVKAGVADRGKPYTQLGEDEVAELYRMCDAMVPVPGQHLEPGQEPEMKPEHTIAEVARTIGISRQQVYNYLRAREREEGKQRKGKPR